jgi:hypothetical protein
MATLSVANLKTLCNAPFLIKSLDVTTGTTGIDFAHGETRSPDILILTNGAADPTASEASVLNKNATEISLDGEADSKAYKLYMIWLSQASGGVTL